MNNNRMIGPVTFEMKVHFGNGDLIGAATCGLAPGRVPTEQDIMELIGQTLKTIPADQDFELLSASDFFNKVIVKEKVGRVGNFAVPADFEYDTKHLAELSEVARSRMKASDEEE
jgi:hypothetical protein